MSKIKVGIHDGMFHADDVFSIAILKLIYNEVETIRTRNNEILKQCDMRVDVGKEYNPKTNDYDHHQVPGPEKRDNGIPYASCGLLWKEFGEKICEIKDVARKIDENLIQGIDADDCGVNIYESTMGKGPYPLPRVINRFNTKDFNSEEQFTMFMRAVELALHVLKKEIDVNKRRYESKKQIEKIIKNSKDSRYIIVEDSNLIVSGLEDTNILYVVRKYPDKWIIKAVRKEKGNFETKVNLPASWGGLDTEELVKVTGVKDVQFCHKDLYLVGATSKEGIIKLLEMALKNNA